MTDGFKTFWVAIFGFIFTTVCIVLFLPTLGHSWNWNTKYMEWAARKYGL